MHSKLYVGVLVRVIGFHTSHFVSVVSVRSKRKQQDSRAVV